MHTQPNFERLKTIFYNTFINSKEAEGALMLQSLNGDFRSHYKKMEEFKEDFNLWLDRLDIRQATVLVDILKKYKSFSASKLPSWMASKKFYIEYNKHGNLDMIKATE